MNLISSKKSADFFRMNILTSFKKMKQQQDQHYKELLCFLLPLLSTHGSAGTNPSCLWASLVYHTNNQPLAPRIDLDFPKSPHMHISGVCEDVGQPGPTRTQGRPLQLSWGSNPQPPCCWWRCYVTSVLPDVWDAVGTESSPNKQKKDIIYCKQI